MNRIVTLLGACGIVAGSFFATLYVLDTYGEPDVFVIGTPVTQEQNRPVVRTRRGSVIPLVVLPPGSPIPAGAVERAQVEPSAITLTGWAIDLEAPGPASHVIAILDGHVVAWTVPNVARADIVSSVGTSYRNSGFTLTLPNTSRAQLSAVQVFGVTQAGLAKELTYTAGAR